MVNLRLSSYSLQGHSQVTSMLALHRFGKATPLAAVKPSRGTPAWPGIEQRVQKQPTGPHREMFTFSTCKYLLALLCCLLCLLSHLYGDFGRRLVG